MLSNTNVLIISWSISAILYFTKNWIKLMGIDIPNWIIGAFGILGLLYVCIKVVFFRKIVGEKNDVITSNEIKTGHGRPFLIFDTDNIIHHNYGANELLESIEANTIQPLRKYEIIITPKNILPSAPLLESIDSYNFVINSIRGKGFQWVYDLDIISYTDTTNVPRFRLEILK